MIHILSDYRKKMGDQGYGKFDFEVIDQDDESYYLSNFTLPKC